MPKQEGITFRSSRDVCINSDTPVKVKIAGILKNIIAGLRGLH
jgi:hypothetical protein